ncbi:hypothetical protein PVW48_14275 [Dinoroseobacter sp. PD6]|uniref:hypothetical protein n=1 Tax=Dinoroseobacter sp. PD6 TaxID=3028384 RepID=UPI00237BC3E2|nr:hypothetical protein [Dinoroseobacter sp. PD6]MDD9717922.1 hypothetical protein [Dinoroseobacter sp. PD6]
MDWREAEEIIGCKGEGDYLLDLPAHEARYREKAPVLADLMVSAASRSAVQSYARFDAAAIAAQRGYRRAMSCANLGALFTSVFGAGAMAWTILAGAGGPLAGYGAGATVLSVGAAISAAAGAAGLYWLRHGRLLETWMGKRAEAETHRIGYFSGLLARAAEGPQESAMLALEYVRRYHFDVQRTYYDHRARQHEASANRTLAIGAAGAFLATLSSFVSVGADGSLQAISALGVFGAAIGAYAIGREQMTQDRRNAERYDRTYSALVAITAKLDEVRAAVAAGRTGAASAFGAAVNEQISNEHRQWLEGQEAAREALERIETALRPDGQGV